MILQVDAERCIAEVSLNGIPLARATDEQPRVSLAAHEYALAGANRLELRISPPLVDPFDTASAPYLATQVLRASARLLLVRAGASADPATCRALAQCDWSLDAGASEEFPLTRSIDVDLPLSFPRWRWMDAPLPPANKALQAQALAFVQGLALDLSRGQADSFMAATKLRSLELAQAYQRDASAEQLRMRTALEQGYASKRLRWPPPQAKDFRLRAIANGRLMECLHADGSTALCSGPDDSGARWALPLRLAWLDGQIFVMR